jgi:hypothetical protein
MCNGSGNLKAYARCDINSTEYYRYRSSMRALPFKVCIFLSVRACYIPRPSHPPCFGYRNNIWARIQITMLLLCHSPYSVVTSQIQYAAHEPIFRNLPPLPPTANKNGFQIRRRQERYSVNHFWMGKSFRAEMSTETRPQSLPVPLAR